MATARSFAQQVFLCSHYESEDVLAETNDVDLIELRRGFGFHFKTQLQRRLLYRDFTKKLIFFNSGLHKVELAQEYDVFIHVCQSYWDLLYLNAVEGWQDKCKTSICWISEMWASELPLFKYWLHSLKRFDHVVLGCQGTVGPLSDVLEKQCHWVPGAVDAIRFSPYPNPPVRVIDVYSIGRRFGGIHDKLLKAAENKSLFYIHDTFRSADAEPYSARQHRDLFANVAKRSVFFPVAPGKMDTPSERKTQIETGYRYYEGAAAGAVLIGEIPDTPVFRDLFPWPDAVIPLKADGSDTMEVLRGLLAEPGKLATMSRRNTQESLLRHDWVHRWKEVFRIAGLEPSPGMIERESRLQNLARLAANIDFQSPDVPVSSASRARVY